VTVLVTGATGFLGRSIVGCLRAEGVAVRALVRGGATPVDADQVCDGDLADPDTFAAALRGIDGVVHAGARVSTSGSWSEFEAVNVVATRRLIEAAVGAGVRRFVHVSSLSVYDVPFDGAVIAEDSPYESGAEERGFYARSKLEADRVAVAAAAAGAAVTIVRPGLLFGPGRPAPLARRSFGLGPFRVLLASRDYLLPLAFVDNVADAIAAALRTERARGRAYTIVDEHVRQADYAQLYKRIAGQSWRPLFPPLGAVRLLAGLAEWGARAAGRRPPITRHQVERTLRSARFDGTRAREELAWRPRVSVEEALRRTFAARDGAAEE